MQGPSFPDFSRSTPSAPPTSPAPGPASKEEVKAKFQNVRDVAATVARENKKTILTLAGIVLFGGLLLMAVMVWFYSRLKMVLIMGLITKTFYLRQYWRETRALGESLFALNFAASVLAWAPLLAAPALVLRGYLRHTLHFKDHWPLLLLGGMVLFGYFAAYFFVMSAVNRFLPIYMGLTGRGPREALRELFSVGGKNVLTGLGYYLLYVLLSIGTGIAMALALGLVGLLLMVLFGAGSLLGVLLVKFLGLSKILLVSIGVVLAIPCFAAVPVLMAVPAETFMNYMGIELVRYFMAWSATRFPSESSK